MTRPPEVGEEVAWEGAGGDERGEVLEVERRTRRAVVRARGGGDDLSLPWDRLFKPDPSPRRRRRSRPISEQARDLARGAASAARGVAEGARRARGAVAGALGRAASWIAPSSDEGKR